LRSQRPRHILHLSYAAGKCACVRGQTQNRTGLRSLLVAGGRSRRRRSTNTNGAPPRIIASR
jgi:hypothetical protein